MMIIASFIILYVTVLSSMTVITLGQLQVECVVNLLNLSLFSDTLQLISKLP